MVTIQDAATADSVIDLVTMQDAAAADSVIDSFIPRRKLRSRRKTIRGVLLAIVMYLSFIGLQYITMSYG